MTRYRAASIHFGFSVLIFSVVSTVMLLIWYPPPLLHAMGGYGLMALIGGVDVVIGPLLTLIVFRSGKRGLKFDLVTIVLFQLAALIYGAYMIAEARPVYMVYLSDRFEIVKAADLDAKYIEQAKLDRFKSLPWFGPQFVGFEFPKDIDENNTVVKEAVAGSPTFHMRPKYYTDLNASKSAIGSKAWPFGHLKRRNPKLAPQLEPLPAQLGLSEAQLGYHTMAARNGGLVVLVNRQTGEPLKILELVPE